jgi:hypothetical protein
MNGSGYLYTFAQATGLHTLSTHTPILMTNADEAFTVWRRGVETAEDALDSLRRKLPTDESAIEIYVAIGNMRRICELIKGCESYYAFLELVELGQIASEEVNGWDFDEEIEVDFRFSLSQTMETFRCNISYPATQFTHILQNINKLEPTPIWFIT